MYLHVLTIRLCSPTFAVSPNWTYNCDITLRESHNDESRSPTLVKERHGLCYVQRGESMQRKE